MLFRHVQRAVLFVAAIVAAVVFFAAGAALRLTMGPISLGAFSQPIADSLNRSVTGAVIKFDEAVIEWSRPDHRINLIVLGTKVFDLNGHIIAQAPKADLDFDALSLLSGRLRLRNFALVGLQLTGVRTADGTVRLGFGRDQNEPNFLDTLRRLLKNSTPGSTTLDTLALQHARIAFLDQPTGLFIVMPDAELSLTSQKAGFDASVRAAAELNGSPFRVDLRASLRDDGLPVSANFRLAGFPVRALADNSPQFAMLAPYPLVTDVSASLSFGDEGLPSNARFQISGSGTLDIPELGGKLRLSRFTAEGTADLTHRRAQIRNISVDANGGTMRGRAEGTADWNQAGISRLSGDVSASGLRLNLPALYANPLPISQIMFHASYDHDTNMLSWQNGSFTAGPISAQLDGSVQLRDSGPGEVRISGTVAPLAVQELIGWWPQSVAEDAREWIAANIPDARIGPLRIDAALPAGALDAPSLPDSALIVTFPFQGLTTRYVPGMTPITRANGTAVLRGDSFEAGIASGSIGPLVVSRGAITIPELHQEGTVAHITAHADGTTADLLRLIDEKPLGYPKRFGVAPGTADGRSAVDLDFQLPLLRELSWDDVKFQVRVRSTQLGLPIAQQRLDSANVDFLVTPSSLTATGRGRFAAVPVNFKWTEDFAASGKSTRIDVTGTADDAERARLRVNLPPWITGPMPFDLTLYGEHFRFTEGTVKTDLTRVAADFPALAFRKAAGAPASGTAQLSFDADGAISMPDFAAAGDGLNLRGAVMMGEGGKLRSLTLSQFRGGQDDFAMTLIPSPRGYAITVQGRSLDVRHLTGLDPQPVVAAGKDSAPVDPLAITVQVQRLLISNRASLRDVAMSIALGANARLNGFELQANGPGDGRLTGHLGLSNGIRALELESDSAGSLIDSVLNFSSVRGGKLDARILFPDSGSSRSRNAPVPDYEGTVTLTNIVLTDQPLLARLFAAGSLDGPLRLLQGQGIALTTVILPFRARAHLVNIADGRASGGAIGGTFTGIYDRSTDKVDISGSLVPLFGINSVLGAIPVIGDLLVSKKGEGILGLTYEMKGNIGEPGITVNPLSILTPGIFRRIFEFGPSRAGETASAGPQ